MRVIRLLAVCVVAATCARDGPVAPKLPADAATAETPTPALSAADRAALAAAITNARAWLLPFVGDEAATQTLGGRFADLATSLERAETDALTIRIAATRRELDALTADPASDRFIELAALGLALDGVEAVIQGRLRLVPFDTTTRDARPPARHSANAPHGPRLDRSVP